MKKLVLLFLLTTPANHAINIKDTLYSIVGIKQEPVEQVHPFAPQVATIEIENKSEMKEITKKLIATIANKDIVGVILVIDSSGGNISQFGALHDLIKKLSGFKPTIALVVSAESGGYLVASASNYIIAHSTSAIGHIGVAWAWQYDKNNCYEFMGAGKYKELGHVPPSQLSEESKAYLQDHLQKDYQVFLELVVTNRPNHLSLDNQKEWAEAQVFVGQEAVQMGLIDEIGTFFEAEQKIKELIRKKHPELVFEELSYV